jgi:hypothetical protein
MSIEMITHFSTPKCKWGGLLERNLIVQVVSSHEGPSWLNFWRGPSLAGHRNAIKSVWQERLFFSEEKKQKTFISPPLPLYPAMACIHPLAQNKSLLVLFFRKEHLSYTS